MFSGLQYANTMSPISNLSSSPQYFLSPAPPIAELLVHGHSVITEMSAAGFSIFRSVLHAALGEIAHAVKVASREIVVAHRFKWAS